MTISSKIKRGHCSQAQFRVWSTAVDCAKIALEEDLEEAGKTMLLRSDGGGNRSGGCEQAAPLGDQEAREYA